MFKKIKILSMTNKHEGLLVCYLTLGYVQNNILTPSLTLFFAY